MFKRLAFVLCLFCATFHQALAVDECYKVLFDIMKLIQSKDANGFAALINNAAFAKIMVDGRTNLNAKSTSNTCANSREFVSFALEALRAFNSYDSSVNAHVQCANLLALGFRSNMRPCTSFGLYSLCLKSEGISTKLGLDEAKLRSFSGNGCDNVNYNELTASVPAEYNNFNAYQKIYNDYKAYSIPNTGSCRDGFRSDAVPDKEGCYQQDFKFIGRCLRERYVGYQQGNDHRTIENNVQSCIINCKTSMANTCKSDLVRFIPWVLRLSKITDKFLSTTLGSINVYAGEASSYVGSISVQDSKDDLLTKNVLDTLSTTCTKASNVISTCLTLRAYMYRFQLNPCVEWLMFYTCLRDMKLASCGQSSDICAYHKFLEGSMNTSPNVNNKWTAPYCANIDEVYGGNSFFASFRREATGTITTATGFEWCKL